MYRNNRVLIINVLTSCWCYSSVAGNWSTLASQNLELSTALSIHLLCTSLVFSWSSNFSWCCWILHTQTKLLDSTADILLILTLVYIFCEWPPPPPRFCIWARDLLDGVTISAWVRYTDEIRINSCTPGMNVFVTPWSVWDTELYCNPKTYRN